MPFELSYVVDLETNMRLLAEESYAGLVDDLWWPKVAKMMPSESRVELMTWILSSARLKNLGKGGNLFFEEMNMVQFQAENEFAGSGLKLIESQVEDLDGHGLDLAGQWIGDITSQFAYWPQRRITSLLLAGETGLAYDKQPFFSTAHPCNPGTNVGATFSNLLIGDGSASTVDYRIDDRVTIDQAYTNLAKAFAALATIQDASNSKTSRRLVPAFIAGGERMRARINLLTNAKQIAMASQGGGGGSTDLSGSITQGLAEPIIAAELSGALTGNAVDDYTYYIFAKEQGASAIGSFVYMERKPFHINYYTGEGGVGTPDGMDAILSRANQLEYHGLGRNGTFYGHPYKVIKVRGAAT